VVDEGLLKGMKAPSLPQTLDGVDRTTIRFHS
jgi:hypothetical protein